MSKKTRAARQDTLDSHKERVAATKGRNDATQQHMLVMTHKDYIAAMRAMPIKPKPEDAESLAIYRRVMNRQKSERAGR
jgi:hypothetical protein